MKFLLTDFECKLFRRCTCFDIFHMQPSDDTCIQSTALPPTTGPRVTVEI